jgi:stress response protein YsnF
VDDQPAADGGRGPALLVSEERPVLGVRREPYRRLRVAKRVVVEQQTVTVEVRREELVVEELEIDGTLSAGARPADAEPLVLVLSREVPDQVLLRTEPVELVRVHVDRHTEQRAVDLDLRRERVDVQQSGQPQIAARQADVEASR